MTEEVEIVVSNAKQVRGFDLMTAEGEQMNELWSLKDLSSGALQVIYHPSHYSSGRTYTALNNFVHCIEGGNLIWSTQIFDYKSFLKYSQLASYGDEFLIVACGRNVMSLAKSDGSVVWSFEITQTLNDVAVVRNRHGNASFAIFIYGDYVYFGLRGNVGAVSAVDGSLVWISEIENENILEDTFSTLSVHEDTSGRIILTAVADRSMFIFDYLSGELLSSFNFCDFNLGINLSSFLVSNGRRYISNRAGVYCFDVETVEPNRLWKYGSAGVMAYTGKLVAFEDNVVVAIDKKLIALNGTTGEELWCVSFNSPLVSITKRDSLVIVTSQHSVSGIDGTSGDSVFKKKLSGGLFPSFYCVSGNGCFDNCNAVPMAQLIMLMGD